MRTRRILKWVGLVLLVGLCGFVFGWVPYWLGGVATTRRFDVDTCAAQVDDLYESLIP